MPVEIIRPDANGDLNGLYVYPSDGIHWNKISEVVPDDDATYVEALYWFATGSWSDSYHLADLADSVTVSNVRVVARVRRIAQNPAGTYPTSIGLGVRIGGVNYYSNYSVSSNSYVTIA